MTRATDRKECADPVVQSHLAPKRTACSVESHSSYEMRFSAFYCKLEGHAFDRQGFFVFNRSCVRGVGWSRLAMFTGDPEVHTR